MNQFLRAKRIKTFSFKHHNFHSSSLLQIDNDIPVIEVNYPNFSFIIHKGNDIKEPLDKNDSISQSRPRLGTIITPHGNIETPNFILCATKAAMKTVTPKQIRDEGSQVILSNTYHLMVTPGSEIIEKMGGLQKFTSWNGPMLTDSGGYQIFSMGHGSVSSEIKGKRNSPSLGWNQTLIKITENGAKFRSYIDGTIHDLTPERSIEIQRQLGADLIVVLDECTPFNVDKDYTRDSMRRSHRWAVRCIEEFNRTSSGKQALYGIVQGGFYNDLRDESTNFVNNQSFFGLAIGGSLGKDKKGMHEIVAYTRSKLRNDKPIHLLGIGGIRDIFHGVRHGIDTFDCVHPTRLGRHGGALVKSNYWSEPINEDYVATAMTIANDLKKKKQLIKVDASLTEKGICSEIPLQDIQKQVNRNLKIKPRTIREHINVSKSEMRNDPRPIDETCNCYTCKNFSRAYLHHLFKAKESLGGTLVTIHNVAFMNRLMLDIRNGIKDDTLDQVESEYVHPDLVKSLNENGIDGNNIGS